MLASHVSWHASTIFPKFCQRILSPILVLQIATGFAKDYLFQSLLNSSSTANTFSLASVTVTRMFRAIHHQVRCRGFVHHTPSKLVLELNTVFSFGFINWHIKFSLSSTWHTCTRIDHDHAKSLFSQGLMAAIVSRTVMIMSVSGLAT